MKKIKYTVSVGIPAFNEEANIGHLIRSLLKQSRDSFTLEKIIVISDGSTDGTVSKVKELASLYTSIALVTGETRLGKGTRLNQLFEMSKSDILVCLDADIKLASTHVLTHLIEPFQNPPISLVSGNDQPLREPGWFNRIARTVFELWYEIRKNVNGGNSVHNIHGSIYATRRPLYGRLRLPANMNADDHHIYFQALKLGYKLYFARSARIYYRLPATLTEYLRQHSRYLNPHTLIADHYGSWVWPHYRVPALTKVRAIMSLLTKKPRTLFAALALQVLLRMAKPFFTQKHNLGRWGMITTTKITIAKTI